LNVSIKSLFYQLRTLSFNMCWDFVRFNCIKITDNSETEIMWVTNSAHYVCNKIEYNEHNM